MFVYLIRENYFIMVPISILLALIGSLIFFSYDAFKAYYEFSITEKSKLSINLIIDAIFIFLWVNAICNYAWYGIITGLIFSSIFAFLKNVKKITEILQQK